MVPVPSERHRAELRTDLQVERTKLAVLVESLAALQRDDQLLAQAQELCGPVERTHLLKEALQALVERTRSGAGPGNQPSLKARS